MTSLYISTDSSNNIYFNAQTEVSIKLLGMNIRQTSTCIQSRGEHTESFQLVPGAELSSARDS